MRWRGSTTSDRGEYVTLAGETITRDEARRELGLWADEAERNTCAVCGMQIRMQIRRGTGICSGRCEEAAEHLAMAEYAVEASAREPVACRCPNWDCPVHGDPGMG